MAPLSRRVLHPPRRQHALFDEHDYEKVLARTPLQRGDLVLPHRGRSRAGVHPVSQVLRTRVPVPGAPPAERQ